MSIDSVGNVVTNLTGSNLAQNATTGFVYVPGVATGSPSGTPAKSYTGAYPLVVDPTDGKLCVYVNAAWHCALLNN